MSRHNQIMILYIHPVGSIKDGIDGVHVNYFCHLQKKTLSSSMGNPSID